MVIFGGAGGVSLHELEVIDHRVRRKTELARDPHALCPRGDGRESNSLIEDVALGPVETPEEIQMPPGATELAVGDRIRAPPPPAF